MSYSRAFERTLLKRSLEGEKQNSFTPPNATQGDKNNYIGFLEGQLDKISAVGELANLLSNKVDNLHTTLTIHEERLLNQARLLNLTQEAIDQGNQQHSKMVSSMKDRMDQLEAQVKKLQDQIRAQPFSPTSSHGSDRGIIPDLMRKVQELQDVQKQQSRQLSLLQSGDEDNLSRIKSQLDSLDSYVQKSIAELKVEAARPSMVEATVMSMVPELKATILSNCEERLAGKVTQNIIAEVRKDVEAQVSRRIKALMDNLLLAILPEVKSYVKESINTMQNEMRRETSVLNTAISKLGEDMNKARKNVSSTQSEVNTLVTLMEDIKKQIINIEKGEGADRVGVGLQLGSSKRDKGSPRMPRPISSGGSDDYILKNGIWTDQKRVYTTFHPLDERQYVPIAIPVQSPRLSPKPPSMSGERFDSEEVQRRIKQLLKNSPPTKRRSRSVDSSSDREQDSSTEREGMVASQRGKGGSIGRNAASNNKGVRYTRSSSADHSFTDSKALNAMTKELRNSGRLYSSSSAADAAGKRGGGITGTHGKGTQAKGKSSYDAQKSSGKAASGIAPPKQRR